MRIFRQLLIILAVWLLGETISRVFSLPIPGNVLGMLLMLALLLMRVIRVEHVSGVSTFFLDNLSFFFIPGSVALMVDYKQVGASLIPALVAILCSSVLVFLVTGLTTEWLLRLIRRRKEKKNGSASNDL